MKRLKDAAGIAPKPETEPATEPQAQAQVVMEDYSMIAPFFCALTTDADLWLYVSSSGGLTCGRRDPDGAIFPYAPVDKIHESIAHTGPVALLRWREGGSWRVWEPFSRDRAEAGARRRLLKNALGTRIVFEESLPDEGLTLTATWKLSGKFGLVREYRLRNGGAAARRIEVLHGLRNLLASGLSRQLQETFSCLADAYKQNEILEPSGLGLFTMASEISDQPAPAEALRATVAWSYGLKAERRGIGADDIERFRRGEDPNSAAASRGVRAHYLEWADLDIAPDGSVRWHMVADTGLDHAAVSRLKELLESGLPLNELKEDIRRCELGLCRHLAAADGLQRGADSTASAHHLANVLFNVMRGGVFPAGYAVDRDDFIAFVRGANRAVAAAHAERLQSLPQRVQRAELRQAVEALTDPQLLRLFREYLPLTFSRRHGDPSRPWNLFSVRVRDAEGRAILAYQGNWRDIFQNWEALALSFPEYVDSMVSKFVNASTADGHNPYRITRDGIDWEEPEPDNPWAGYGYWGDHQIIYLLKLLELSAAHFPGQLETQLDQHLFSYADVPYRIKPYREMLADPRNTLTCDSDKGKRLRANARRHGSDQKLVLDADGQPVLVSLAEKLLVPLLAKWGNFVPGGGIWMNTQRPEWNDANNALVGNGLSMVTLCYMRRHQAFLRELFGRRADAEFRVAAPVAELLRAIQAALSGASAPRACADPAARRALIDQLGEAATQYREHIHASGWTDFTALPAGEILAFLESALEWTDACIHCNRRKDGLYHAYNLLALEADGAHIRHLDPMLEGQVAVLSSGLLSPDDTIDLLDALRASPLYCLRRNSYMLYPDKPAIPFMRKNRVDPDAARRIPLLAAMLARGDSRIVIPDTAAGCLRFHPDFGNQAALARRLAQLRAEGAYPKLDEADCAQVLELYESVFHHHAFTGRSGSMFAYEGLGSIYWHMVAKLLLAAQETLQRAVETGAPQSTCAKLDARYEAIRDGLGFRKSASQYGAFPTDPYSHTPAHAGAQQPGMTGQVKEEILTRRGELGVRVRDGAIAFAPVHRLIRDEFFATAEAFEFIGRDGAAETLPLPPGSLAFTLCQTPVLYRLGGTGEAPSITVHRKDGEPRRIAGDTLPPPHSGAVFSRDPNLHWIEVVLADLS
jgi:hypothetical protein